MQAEQVDEAHGGGKVHRRGEIEKLLRGLTVHGRYIEGVGVEPVRLGVIAGGGEEERLGVVVEVRPLGVVEHGVAVAEDRRRNGHGGHGIRTRLIAAEVSGEADESKQQNATVLYDISPFGGVKLDILKIMNYYFQQFRVQRYNKSLIYARKRAKKLAASVHKAVFLYVL